MTPPPFPDICRRVWDAFLALHARRSSSGMGPNPISPSDVNAWLALRGRRLSPNEVDMLFALDDLWLTIMLPAPGEGSADDVATPMLKEDGTLDRDGIASGLAAIFRALPQK